MGQIQLYLKEKKKAVPVIPPKENLLENSSIPLDAATAQQLSILLRGCLYGMVQKLLLLHGIQVTAGSAHYCHS